MRQQLRNFSTLMECSKACAAEFFKTARRVIDERGEFTFVLSGGSTPRIFYSLLADIGRENLIDWKRVFFFWGDERCVPPESPGSNFGMAADLLLAKIGVPPENIFRMPGEMLPEEGAAAYEKELERFFSHGRRSGGGWPPRFDLILLGIGSDGHTASLFPRGEVLHEEKRLVADVPAPAGMDPAVPRLTMTLPLINRARLVWFLAAGADKARIVTDIFANPGMPSKYPAAAVQPEGELVWYMAEQG